LEFKNFGFEDTLMEGINAMGYEKATPVQIKAIPLVQDGKDLIGSAQTGTGKTAAFLLPIINNLLVTNANDHHIKALVIVPTRELAIQIDQQMEGFSYFTNVSSIAVFGGGDGSSFDREKKALTTGADVVIATPGRLIAHLNMKYVQVNELNCLVLDEADRMLDMGFYEDIMKIISFLPKKRQNLMFSATMPPKIRTLAKTVLQNPEEINIAISKPAENILQIAFVVYNNQKIPLVDYLFQSKKLERVLIFCARKSSAKVLSKELKKLGMLVEDIHSDLDQNTRIEVLNNFKNKKLNALVATDILSRGIDIEDIELIINYDVPNDGEDYIHRIGRTARAASKGAAFTFINEEEQYQFSEIEAMLGKPVPKAKLPESVGQGPAYNPIKRPKVKSGRNKFSKGRKPGK